MDGNGLSPRNVSKRLSSELWASTRSDWGRGEVAEIQVRCHGDLTEGGVGGGAGPS